ncbi:MAG: phasin family protein [Luteimonas sp.]
MNQFNQNQISEQFANSTRQFADTAAQVNRLTLENAENVFGLQLAAIQQNVNATFAYLGELAEVRDLDGLKSVLPKGMQVARENVERSISVGQEVLGRTVKTNETIGQIAKSQIESATAKVQAETETVVNRTSEQVRTNFEAANKAANKSK